MSPSAPIQISAAELPEASGVRSCPTLLIAAAASGQGKTTLTAALARHHRRQGRRVRVFKTGPDFLDPMILARAGASEVEPLDLWMVGPEGCAAALHAAAAEADLILIEGAMGLFDGTPSAADLAARFDLPVAVLIDARGMGQSFGALAFGLCRLRAGLRIHGVLANRVASPRHEQMLRAGLASVPAPSIDYLGALSPLGAAQLPSRHLGLVQALEIADLEQRLETLAEQIAHTALVGLPPPVAFAPLPATSASVLPRPLAGLRIAIARDAAFSFLYAANVRLLQRFGAELVFFSPLAGESFAADAVYLPGGYPELHLSALSAAGATRAALGAHVAAGRPLYAECGGMLYLLEHLTDADGQGAVLAGVLPGVGRMQGRLAGLGMQSLDLPGGRLRGHSFHHSTMSTPMAPAAWGERQRDGERGEPFFRHGSVRASYLHLYFPSAPAAAANLFLP